MESSISTDKRIRSELVQHDISILDLVFAMDCTGSMEPYIRSATENIRLIVKEIVTNEHSDIRLALIEYRDHPPQETTFVTNIHDFTDNVEEMKQWLDQCQARGGGDTPEAVADALLDTLTLAWRSKATKICILISDAPPHGLNSNDDSFSNGCPAGHDPVKIVRKMAENNITLYTVGVEPPIIPYRDFFMSLAYITGGQYIPLVDANHLAQIIIGGVREEISLDRLMDDAQQEIVREIQQAEEDGVDEQEAVMRVNRVFHSKNIRVKQMRNTRGATSKTVEECYSKCLDMHELRSKYQMSKEKLEQNIEELNYALKDESINVEQTKRLIQKVKNRKLIKSKDDQTTSRRKNNRDNQKQENDNSKRDSIDRLVHEENNDQKETFLHDDNITEGKQLLDQDITRKQSDVGKRRRNKRTSSTDVNKPKHRINRKLKNKSNEIFDSTKALTDDIVEPMISTNTVNDNQKLQAMLHTEQVHSSSHQQIRLNYDLLYLISLSIIVVIIAVYFSFFK